MAESNVNAMQKDLDEANAKLAAIKKALETNVYDGHAVKQIAAIISPPPAAPQQTYMQLPPGRKR